MRKKLYHFQSNQNFQLFLKVSGCVRWPMSFAVEAIQLLMKLCPLLCPAERWAHIPRELEAISSSDTIPTQDTE